MNQPTKEIKTPQGNIVVAKEWITGREQKSIQASIISKETSKGEYSNDTIEKYDKALIESIIVSIDEVTDNLYETCLDLRSESFNFVRDYCQEVFMPSQKDEKTDQ